MDVVKIFGIDVLRMRGYNVKQHKKIYCHKLICFAIFILNAVWIPVNCLVVRWGTCNLTLSEIMTNTEFSDLLQGKVVGNRGPVRYRVSCLKNLR